MPLRVVLFVDAQNMYEGARETFFKEGGASQLGQFHPSKLGALIASRKPFGQEKTDRELAQVRIYSGRPSSSKDSKTYGAHRRQSAAWEKDGVIVTARTLRYPPDWPTSRAIEKGIDVALAVDFVALAVEGQFDVEGHYDIGVIASTDTDLLPAIEYVVKRGGGVQAEVTCWWGEGSNPQLSLPDLGLWCHRLTKADYDKVADYRDYNIA